MAEAIQALVIPANAGIHRIIIMTPFSTFTDRGGDADSRGPPQHQLWGGEGVGSPQDPVKVENGVIMIIISWIPDNASHFRDDISCHFPGLLRYARNDEKHISQAKSFLQGRNNFAHIHR
jgi:hypothetical protein